MNMILNNHINQQFLLGIVDESTGSRVHHNNINHSMLITQELWTRHYNVQIAKTESKEQLWHSMMLFLL